MHTMESNSLSLLNASILENKYRSNSNILYYSWQNELNNFGEIFSCDKIKLISWISYSVIAVCINDSAQAGLHKSA